MEWLNYHHLRYFWVVAKEGGLKKAADKLHVSQPSISEQINELEEALGERLFRRSGRSNVLTDAGQIVLRYAEEIFGLGAELLRAVKQRPGLQSLRFYMGVADAIPKLVVNDILKPVLAMPQKVHIICREGKLEDLMAQLAAHRLDLVVADEPVSSSLKFRAFTTSWENQASHSVPRPGWPPGSGEAFLPRCTTRRLCCQPTARRCGGVSSDGSSSGRFALAWSRSLTTLP